MNAEIISIGDEILIGQIVNNNAAWMAQQLNLIGISVRQISTVGDDKQELLRIFLETRKRADIILITGGLGPTSDDITKPVLCEFFGTKLIFKEELFKDVKFQFELHGIKMPAMNRGQAEVPENCTPIRNKNGTAPGMFFEIENKIWISLPGVPYEMKAMMNDFVIPELLKRFSKEFILHKTIYTQGVGESTLAEKIKTWEDSLSSEGIKLAYLPSPGIVKLRLSAKGFLDSARNDNKKITKAINKKINELKKIIPELIFSIEEFGKEPESLEKIIGEILRKKKKTLAVAESCTGGFIGHLITSVSGSSDYFKGGIIAYSNEVKIIELGVNKKTLKEKGAVSKEIAEQMAQGVRKKLNADFGISTTGIAGPTGGTKKKPVGTVWIAVSSSKKIISQKFNFGNNRERNIQKSGITALNMLRMLFKK
ncbi:MAG: competence/damage-inducible protein A [Bacteroidetes bacterium]|nr:competence/damage-inducible protein A [Bacteroidota bacterium]